MSEKEIHLQCITDLPRLNEVINELLTNPGKDFLSRQAIKWKNTAMGIGQISQRIGALDAELRQLSNLKLELIGSLKVQEGIIHEEFNLSGRTLAAKGESEEQPKPAPKVEEPKPTPKTEAKTAELPQEAKAKRKYTKRPKLVEATTEPTMVQ